MPERPDPDPAPVVPLIVVCRDALGLVPARPDQRRHTLERLTLHHTAVQLEAPRLAPHRLRGHQRFHQRQGWSDIAYHYGIDLAGNVYELRDPAIPGDTFTDYDPTGHFLVVCEGDFDRQAPTDLMLEAAAGLFAWAAGHYGLELSTLAAHRDFAATACPGDALYARMDEIGAVADRLLGTIRPELERRCGPEGEAIVTAIEATGAVVAP